MARPSPPIPTEGLDPFTLALPYPPTRGIDNGVVNTNQFGKTMNAIWNTVFYAPVGPVAVPIYNPFEAEDLLERIFGKALEAALPKRLFRLLRNPTAFIAAVLHELEIDERQLLIWLRGLLPKSFKTNEEKNGFLFALHPILVFLTTIIVVLRLSQKERGPRTHRVVRSRDPAP